MILEQNVKDKKHIQNTKQKKASKTMKPLPSNHLYRNYVWYFTWKFPKYKLLTSGS